MSIQSRGITLTPTNIGCVTAVGMYRQEQRFHLVVINIHSEPRNQELIADNTLVQPVDSLLNLRYNVHSQLTEIHIKHKPGAPVQIDKEGKERVAVTLRFAPFTAELTALKIYFFTLSVFTLQIEFFTWIQCLPFTFVMMLSNLAMWVII